MVKKTNIKKIILTVVVFVAVFALTNVAKIKAGSNDNTTGWIWGGSDDGAGNSTGVGWVSMNNVNPGAGGAVSYGTTIPAGNCTGAACNVTGYAYSENLGYIDFDPQDHCTTGVADTTRYQAASCTEPLTGTTGGVSRSGNNLVGWARFVEIAKASATGNSGGWSGWIQMAGSAQNGSSYGVTIDPTTGSLGGYAWNGESTDGLGAISFNGLSQNGTPYNGTIPLPPTVTLNASPLTINLDSGLLPQPVAISWTQTGATSCVESCNVGGVPTTCANWGSTIASPGASGTVSGIMQTVPIMDYKLTCTGPGGTTSADQSVTTGCYVKSCSGTSCSLGTDITATGSTSTAACDALSTCTTDDDCTPRTPKNWQEVAP